MSSKNNRENIKVEVVQEQQKSSNNRTDKDTLTLENLTKWLNDFFVQKCPPLSQKTKDLIVKYLYIVDLILIVLMIFTIVLVIFSVISALAALVALFTKGFGYALFPSFYWSIINIAKALFGIYFGYRAIDGLKQKTDAGWTNMYYFILVLFLGSVFSFDFQSIFGSVLGVAASLYLLFQVRSEYKGVVKQATK